MPDLKRIVERSDTPVPTKNVIRTVRVTDRAGLEPANKSQRRRRRRALR